MSILSDAIETSNFSLHNLDNYNDNLKQASNIVFLKYNELANTYCKLFYESITIQDKNYYIYLFKTGLETISHVFNNILLYTNNVDLTFYYCQKAYLYFVEFISQIDNVNHSFLQLNGKDASLFVYKKTIFEINNDKRKNFECKNTFKINNIKLLTKIYNDIVLLLISFDYSNISGIDEKIMPNIEKLFNLYNISCSRENSPMKQTNSGFNLTNIETKSENIKKNETKPIDKLEHTENMRIKIKNKKKKLQYENKNSEEGKAITKNTKDNLNFNETLYNYKLLAISEFLNNIHIYNQTDDTNILFTIENNLLLFIEALCIKIKKYDIKQFTNVSSILNLSAFNKMCEITPNKFISLMLNA